MSAAQAVDISNPNYMGFQKGNVEDKGWSYSMPPKNLAVPGHGGKESKKTAGDVGARSPTRSSPNHM